MCGARMMGRGCARNERGLMMQWLRCRIVLCLFASALVLSACGGSRTPANLGCPRPPAADLVDRAEPAAPAVTAGEAAYEGWNDDVLMWGRELQAQMGRLREWVAKQGAEPPG